MNNEHIEISMRKAYSAMHSNSPEPTDDFADGFDAGLCFALFHQWISVEERLPEDDTMVTAHSPNGRIDVLKYHDGEFVDELGQSHCVDYFIAIPELNPEKKKDESR